MRCSQRPRRCSAREVVALRNATSYSCRNRYGGAKTPLSEHALANALDVAEFILASGEHVTVLDSWPKTAAPPPVPEPKPERSESGSATSPAKTATASDKKGNGVIGSAKAEPAPEADGACGRRASQSLIQRASS